MAKVANKVDVAIIGAGFGGLGVGIALQNHKLNNFVIFEGEPDVGGSWRTNTYPGCACDVPSNLYSYSFEPNPYWPEAFSKQSDIQKYIEHCADKYGLRPKTRFNTKVTSANFDGAKGSWQVATSDGTVTEARVLVPATGALSHPKYPDIKGRETYQGEAIHSARWNPEVKLKGKRVGVLGSGASAIQIVPSIAKEVGDLKVFQRTPSWVLPKRNRSFTAAEHERWAKHPWTQQVRRLGLYWLMETALPGIMWFPEMLEIGERLHKQNLNKAIKDPELRRKLTPTYKVACKRTLVSDDWFPAFARENVHLITDRIEEITPKGIKTADGKEHELDVLIYATGYDIGAPAYPFEIKGLGGVSLSDHWGSQRKAYYGMSVSHFPNMLLIMGPNTGPGHTSVLIYQEAQYEYVAKYTKLLKKRGLKYYDVKDDMVNRQFEAFQNRMRNSSWLSGCKSWYLNEDGTNSTMWPGFSFEYILRMKRINLGAYNAV
ncbi:MAG: NAD(P)/FAD-dependent oxidoreductase [Bdellovibrionota bacterium]